MAIDWLDWVPSFSSTVALSLGGWIGSRLFETRLRASVSHDFDLKLEDLRSSLRRSEAVVEAIRGGAISAMASRQAAIDARRILAVDQLWAAAGHLRKATGVVTFMGITNFDEVATQTQKDEKLRQPYQQLRDTLKVRIDELVIPEAERARPFVSPLAWALYAASQTIAAAAVAQLQVLSSGMDPKMINWTAAGNLVKAALPDLAMEVDAHPHVTVMLHAPALLEQRLLAELQRGISDPTGDRENVARATLIANQVNELKDQIKGPLDEARRS